MDLLSVLHALGSFKQRAAVRDYREGLRSKCDRVPSVRDVAGSADGPRIPFGQVRDGSSNEIPFPRVGARWGVLG